MKKVINSILKSIKKAAKWYFSKIAESGCYMITTGTFPVNYYEYRIKEDKK